MKIRVAHIATVYQSLAVLLHDQMRATQEAGYEVAAISSAPSASDPRRLEGIRFIPVPMERAVAPVADLVSLWRLVKAFRRERFDIVHTHTPKAGLLGRLAGRFTGTPVVCHTIHGFHFHSLMPVWQERFYRRLEMVASRCCDRVYSQNREDMKTAVRHGITREGQLEFLGNGIDVRTFDRARLRDSEIAARRAGLGLDPEGPVIGFVGRLAARRKGFADFLATAKRIAGTVPDARFLIIGEPDQGKADAVTPELAEEYGIANRCLFLGRRPPEEMPILYSLMSVLVLPSLFEGLPRAILESAAMGVPAVASAVKGNREAVRSGVTGWLVPHGDVAELTAAIVRLLADDGERRRMGAAARQLAEEEFDERRVIGRLLDSYDRILRDKRPRLEALPSASGGIA